MTPVLSSVKKELLQSSAWYLLATVFSRVGPLVAFMLAIRWLGPEAYGEIALTQSTILMASGSLGIGLGMAATKCVAEARLNDPVRAGATILAFGVFVAGGAALAALGLLVGRHNLSQWATGSNQLAALLALGAPLLIVTAYNFYQVGVLSGFNAYQRVSIASGAGALVSIPIIVLGVLLGGIEGAMLALAISTAVTCALFHWEIRRACRAHGIAFQVHEVWNARAIVWRFGVPAVLAHATVAPLDWIGFALLARQPAGFSEIGLYCTANQWCMSLRFLPLAIGTALLSSVSQSSIHRSTSDHIQTTRFGMAMVLTVAIITSSVLGLASPWIMWCYGPPFADRWLVLTLLMPAAAAIAVQLAGERALAGFGWIWTGLWLNLLRGALFGLLTLWTVHFGANGLAISRSATCIVHAAIVLAWIVAVTNAAGKKCRSTGGEPHVLSRFMAGEANEATHAA